MRQLFFRTSVFAFGCALIFSTTSLQADTAANSSSAAWAQVPAILQRIIPPVFPAHEFTITRFGAVADGKTDCTAAIAKAIDACAEAGGGRVVIPAGEFLTGPIHLKSNGGTASGGDEFRAEIQH